MARGIEEIQIPLCLVSAACCGTATLGAPLGPQLRILGALRTGGS